MSRATWGSSERPAATVPVVMSIGVMVARRLGVPAAMRARARPRCGLELIRRVRSGRRRRRGCGYVESLSVAGTAGDELTVSATHAAADAGADGDEQKSRTAVGSEVAILPWVVALASLWTWTAAGARRGRGREGGRHRPGNGGWLPISCAGLRWGRGRPTPTVNDLVPGRWGIASRIWSRMAAMTPAGRWSGVVMAWRVKHLSCGIEDGGAVVVLLRSTTM